MPVCNLNASTTPATSPTQVVLGCSATLTASCSNLSTPPSPATPYTWSATPGSPSTSISAISGVTPAALGTYNYTVSGTNEIGTGAASPSATVTVVPASCTVSSQAVLQGNTATFTASCNNSPTSAGYTWIATSPSGTACISASTGATGSFATSATNCDELGSPYTVTVTATALCGSPGTNTPAATLTVTDTAVPFVLPGSVTISGTAQVGQILIGSYTYQDPNNDPQGASTYRWLNDIGTVLATGTYNGTAITYPVAAGDQGHTITFEITPISTVPTTGIAVASNPTATVTAAVAAVPVCSLTADTATNSMYYGFGAFSFYLGTCTNNPSSFEWSSNPTNGFYHWYDSVPITHAYLNAPTGLYQISVRASNAAGTGQWATITTSCSSTYYSYFGWYTFCN